MAGTYPRCLQACPCEPPPPAPPTNPECRPGCICPALYRPVCCGGDRTYSNSCEAQCCGFNAVDCTPGACPAKTCKLDCICPAIALPVCCEGVEYPNQCRANCCGASGCTAGAC